MGAQNHQVAAYDLNERYLIKYSKRNWSKQKPKLLYMVFKNRFALLLFALAHFTYSVGLHSFCILMGFSCIFLAATAAACAYIHVSAPPTPVAIAWHSFVSLSQIPPSLLSPLIQVEPPFKPQVTSETDTRYFDEQFTKEPVQFTPPKSAASFAGEMPYFQSFSYGARSVLGTPMTPEEASVASRMSTGLEWLGDKGEVKCEWS